MIQDSPVVEKSEFLTTGQAWFKIILGIFSVIPAHPPIGGGNPVLSLITQIFPLRFICK